MRRSPDAAAAGAALFVVLATALGGAFWPGQRLVVGLALVGLWTVAAWRWTGGPDRVEAWFAALLGWSVLSALWVGAAPLKSKETITTWVVAFALWAIARRADGPNRRPVLRILAAGAALVAAGIIADSLTAGQIRVGGLLENPNLAAALLLPTLPLGWMGIGPIDRKVRLAWAAVVAAGLVLTGSRAGFLALVVMVAVVLPRGRPRTFGSAAVGALGLAVLVWRFISQPDLLAWHRIAIWKAVLEIWARRPVTGVGPGSLVEAAGVERILHPDQVGRYQFVVSYAESTPLAVLVQLGLVGLGLAMVAAVWWLAAARSAGALGQPAVRAALAGAAVFVLFHDLLTADPVLWWWAVLAGTIERPLGAGTEEAGTERPSVGVRWLLGLAMAWLTAWGLLAPAHARVSWRGSPATADAVERVLRVEPWFDEAPAGRVGELLATTERWTWTTSAEALHWAEVARRARPGLARRWADVGRVRLRILTDCGGTGHDVAAADAALVRACELDPHLPWNWLERARLARVVGEYEAAITHVFRALKEEPNTVRGWLLLARLEAEHGRMDAAHRARAEAERRSELASRSGLTEYERELLAFPGGQWSIPPEIPQGDSSEGR